MKKMLYILLITIICMIPLQSLNVQAVADTNAPVIEEIKVLTPNVAVGEKVKIQVKISDDATGLDYVRILLFSPSQAHNTMPIVYAGQNDPLTNTYVLESEVLTDNFEQGKWKVDLVQTKDRNQNIGNYNVHNTTLLKNVTFNFGIVVEEKAATTTNTTSKATTQTNDGFKALNARKNVALDGEFTYIFNTDVANSTFTKKNIYVTDENDVNVPLLFVKEYDAKTKKSTVTIAPVENYKKSSAYTLYIKDIIGKDGKILRQYNKMTFTTKK